MSKTRIAITTPFIAAISTVIIALGIAAPAMADDVELNPVTTPIPISETVNVGASVDMSDITYTIAINAKQGHPQDTTAPTGVYTGPDVQSTAAPIVIVPSDIATTTTGATTNFTDTVKIWDYTRTLTDLFGSASAFPQAGLYEYEITQTHANGTSADTAKWDYSEPVYTLQVLVKNNTTLTGLEFEGWTLVNGSTKVNSGARSDDGKAAFSATYKAKSMLNITKQVTGDYASTTFDFPITITLTLPEYCTGTIASNITPTNASLPGGVVATAELPSAKQVVYTALLHHGETASFEVPTGTRYSVDETSLTDEANLTYTAGIEWTVDDGSTGNMEPQYPDTSTVQVNIYNASNTLVETLTMAQLRAASEAIAEDGNWEENSDKANNFTTPNIDSVTGLYTSYMKQDYSFVFSDDPQSTPMKYRIVGINHDKSNGVNAGLTFMAKNSLDVGYPMLSDAIWSEVGLRTALNSNNSSLANNLPISVRANAKEVTKYTNTQCDFSSADIFAPIATTDRFWIPSNYELQYVEASSHLSDTDMNTQYDFFKYNGYPERQIISDVDGSVQLTGELGSDSPVEYNDCQYYFDHQDGDDYVYISWGYGKLVFDGEKWIQIRYSYDSSELLNGCEKTSSGGVPVADAISEDSNGCGQFCWLRTFYDYEGSDEGSLSSKYLVLQDGNISSLYTELGSSRSAAGILTCFCL